MLGWSGVETYRQLTFPYAYHQRVAVVHCVRWQQRCVRLGEYAALQWQIEPRPFAARPVCWRGIHTGEHAFNETDGCIVNLNDSVTDVPFIVRQHRAAEYIVDAICCEMFVLMMMSAYYHLCVVLAQDVCHVVPVIHIIVLQRIMRQQECRLRTQRIQPLACPQCIGGGDVTF